MCARILKPNTTLMTVQSLNHICMIVSLRSKTHRSTEIQYNDCYSKIDHYHHLYKAIVD